MGSAGFVGFVGSVVFVSDISSVKYRDYVGTVRGVYRLSKVGMFTIFVQILML